MIRGGALHPFHNKNVNAFSGVKTKTSCFHAFENKLKYKSSVSSDTGNTGTLTILQAFLSHLFDVHNQLHLVRNLMSIS